MMHARDERAQDVSELEGADLDPADHEPDGERQEDRQLGVFAKRVQQVAHDEGPNLEWTPSKMTATGAGEYGPKTRGALAADCHCRPLAITAGRQGRGESRRCAVNRRIFGEAIDPSRLLLPVIVRQCRRRRRFNVTVAGRVRDFLERVRHATSLSSSHARPSSWMLIGCPWSL